MLIQYSIESLLIRINKNTNTNIKVNSMKYLFDECDLDQNELQFNIFLTQEKNHRYDAKQ